MVEHERVAHHRLVAPQADLRGELHVAPLPTRELHAEPRSEVGDPGTGEHRVRARSPARGRRGGAPHKWPRAPMRSPARRARGRPRSRAAAWIAGFALARSARHAVAPEPIEILVLGRGLQDPMADPLVVVVAPRRGPRLDPEVVVLAVALDREVAGEEPAGVRSERDLAHREHPMRGDAHEIRARPQIVDHPLDGDDRPAPGPERAPHAFEQRRRDRDVAGPVGHRRVQDRDVGLQRREQSRRARTACRLRRKPSLSAIDDPAIDRVVTAGSPRAPASSRCANARNDQCSTSTAPEV